MWRRLNSALGFEGKLRGGPEIPEEPTNGGCVKFKTFREQVQAMVGKAPAECIISAIAKVLDDAYLDFEDDDLDVGRNVIINQLRYVFGIKTVDGRKHR